MHALVADLALLLALLALVFAALTVCLSLALALGGRRLPRTPPGAQRRNGAHHPGFGPPRDRGCSLQRLAAIRRTPGTTT